MDANTAVYYNSSNNQGYFNSLITLSKGKYSILGGIGNKLGPIQFQHFQQSYRFSKAIRGRVGIFYNQEGVGWDYYATNKLTLFTELYDLSNMYYVLGTSIKLKKHVLFNINYRQDSVLSAGGIDIGIKLIN